MVALRKIAYAAGIVVMAGVAPIGYARTNQCLTDVARNEFVKYRKTPEGRAAMIKTLSQLEDEVQSADNDSRIANLKHNLSVSAQFQAPTSTLCQAAALVSREGIDDTVDEFSLGYERI